MGGWRATHDKIKTNTYLLSIVLSSWMCSITSQVLICRFFNDFSKFIDCQHQTYVRVKSLMRTVFGPTFFAHTQFRGSSFWHAILFRIPWRKAWYPWRCTNMLWPLIIRVPTYLTFFIFFSWAIIFLLIYIGIIVCMLWCPIDSGTLG